MSRALCMIRPEPHYRADAFVKGLKACGLTIVPGLHEPTADDVLVIWNRYGHVADMAKRFERVKAAVIIAENGYVGARDNNDGRPLAADGDRLYALALGQHNGAGSWYVGNAARWRVQGIDLKPWREGGEHVLLFAQRGIGSAQVASPPDWLQRTEKRLRAITKRPIKIRGHPGNKGPSVPLIDDLRNAWCAVTWASSAGVRALCMGWPIFSDFPKWIVRPAARDLDQIEQPLCDDAARENAINRVAWAQWTLAEIEEGVPFRRLMDLHRG